MRVSVSIGARIANFGRGHGYSIAAEAAEGTVPQGPQVLADHFDGEGIGDFYADVVLGGYWPGDL
jgi:hypothetical protein